VRLTLAILYSPTYGKPLKVATVNDSELLLRAAEIAINDAEVRAATLSDVDPLLGDLERSEATRLRNVLKRLLPGLAIETTETQLQPVM
jgi:hypothetical protein